jgi:exonuclease III
MNPSLIAPGQPGFIILFGSYNERPEKSSVKSWWNLRPDDFNTGAKGLRIKLFLVSY